MTEIRNGAKAKPIFLITHEFYPLRGGIATFTEEMAKAAAELGYTVEVWAQSAPPKKEKVWPFRLKRLPLKGSHDLLCQIKLAVELIKHRRVLRQATVYLPEPGPMLTMMILQFFHAFTPARLILTFHGSEIIKFSANPLRRVLGKRLISHATRISTLSGYTQQLLLRHFPEAKSKLVLTPGALRTDLSAHESNPKKKTKLVILTVGRLHPRKGQLLTLQALQNLPLTYQSQIEYWIVSGQSKEGYDEKVKALAHKTPELVVNFFHDVSDERLSEIYSESDIFAMTSTSHPTSIEGFGLVYLEAAAHGLPVVAHDIGGVSEAVRHTETGFLVPEDEPSQLTETFKTLIENKALREKLGAAGKAWAKQNTWTQAAEHLLGNSS